MEKMERKIDAGLVQNKHGSEASQSIIVKGVQVGITAKAGSVR